MLLLGTEDKVSVVKNALEYDKIVEDESNHGLEKPISLITSISTDERAWLQPSRADSVSQ